jgi:hypothetical protein
MLGPFRGCAAHQPRRAAAARTGDATVAMPVDSPFRTSAASPVGTGVDMPADPRVDTPSGTSAAPPVGTRVDPPVEAQAHHRDVQQSRALTTSIFALVGELQQGLDDAAVSHVVGRLRALCDDIESLHEAAQSDRTATHMSSPREWAEVLARQVGRAIRTEDAPRVATGAKMEFGRHSETLRRALRHANTGLRQSLADPDHGPHGERPLQQSSRMMTTAFCLLTELRNAIFDGDEPTVEVMPQDPDAASLPAEIYRAIDKHFGWDGLARTAGSEGFRPWLNRKARDTLERMLVSPLGEGHADVTYTDAAGSARTIMISRQFEMDFLRGGEISMNGLKARGLRKADRDVIPDGAMEEHKRELLRQAARVLAQIADDDDRLAITDYTTVNAIAPFITLLPELGAASPVRMADGRAVTQLSSGGSPAVDIQQFEGGHYELAVSFRGPINFVMVDGEDTHRTTDRERSFIAIDYRLRMRREQTGVYSLRVVGAPQLRYRIEPRSAGDAEPASTREPSRLARLYTRVRDWLRGLLDRVWA